MAKSLKFRNALLCEFVAKGDRNKHTLVNVFSGDIIVQEFPTKLHVGLYMEYIPQDVNVREFWLHFKLDKEIPLKAQINMPIVKPNVPVSVVIQLVEVVVDRDLTFSVEAACEGFRKTTVLSKRIYKSELPPG